MQRADGSRGRVRGHPTGVRGDNSRHPGRGGEGLGLAAEDGPREARKSLEQGPHKCWGSLEPEEPRASTPGRTLPPARLLLCTKPLGQAASKRQVLGRKCPGAAHPTPIWEEGERSNTVPTRGTIGQELLPGDRRLGLRREIVDPRSAGLCADALFLHCPSPALREGPTEGLCCAWGTISCGSSAPHSGQVIPFPPCGGGRPLRPPRPRRCGQSDRGQHTRIPGSRPSQV